LFWTESAFFSFGVNKVKKVTIFEAVLIDFLSVIATNGFDEICDEPKSLG
jgi:hypothetical protein